MLTRRCSTILIGVLALCACSHEANPDAPPSTAGGAGGSGGSQAGSGNGSSGGAAVGTGGESGTSEPSSGGSSSAGTGGASAAAGSDAAGAGAGGESGAAAASGSQAAGAGGDGAMPVDGDLIAAPSGSDAAPGTLAEPTTLTSALTRIAAGNTIQLRAGTYSYDVQITIATGNDGSAGKLKQLVAYADEKPVLDFSSQPYTAGASNPRGLQINGNYWHVEGLTVRGAADNGIYVAGNDNVVENCVTSGNRDTGLQIGRVGSSEPTIADWPANNLILNCESYDNFDPPSGENADGFAAKLTVGPGNVFRGCVSHHNIDDGWDLFTKTETGPIGVVTIDQCIAHHNGTLTNGMSTGSGDRNGFKLGGDKIEVAHVVTRSISFANGKDGFTWNSNPGAIRLSNNLGVDNGGSNYTFGSNTAPTKAVFTNNVSFRTAAGGTDDKTLGADASNSNCWWNGATVNGKGLSVSAADFASSVANPTPQRDGDANLDLTPWKLAAGSDLINAGVMPAGALPFDASYYQSVPDLGAVETQ